jgi:tryptophan synthase beta chain
MIKGRFNNFGGQYVPETLMNALKELEIEYEKAINDEKFQEEYMNYLIDYVGRETPLYYAENISKELNGAKIYLKREDLNHTGAHKINNAIGQIILARRMGKKNIIAETGAGQHGVATATVCAKFNMSCKVFMGIEDIKRQSLNVKKMELLGAEVIPVESGSGTLKDAVNEAIRCWVSNAEDTFYIIGSVVGPHPYPTMVRDFQKIIGIEARKQIIIKEGRVPDYIVASVGGGSNSMGIFYPFIKDKEVNLIGVEGAGSGIERGKHSATMSEKKKGVMHGMMTYLLRDVYGNIREAYSISAGLDYPAIGPEHAYLEEIERAKYVSVTDKEALDAFLYLTKREGIIPALESSHAVAYAMKLARNLDKDKIIIVNLSGRGDKDLEVILENLDENKGGDKDE